MIFTDSLWIMLNTGAPDDSTLHLTQQRLMDSVTEVAHCAPCARNDDRCLIVWNLALGLRVYTDQVEVVPHLLHELIKVPFILGADGHVVGELIKEVKLFDCDRVNLVQNVDARNVDSVALNNIDKVIHGVVLSEDDVAVADFILVQNRPDSVIRHLGQLDAVALGNGDTATVLPLQLDGGLFLVETDAEAFKLTLNDSLVSHGLLAVKHDQNESAGASHTNDLFTTTFTVLGTFDNTWQIEQLDLGATIVVHTRDTCQGCKLVICRFRERARQLGQECRLAD